MNRYEILTPDGYKDFKNVIRKISNNILTVFLEDNFNISCTSDHQVLTPNGYYKMSDLKKDDEVITLSGPKKILTITKDNIETFVYDAFEVKDNHCYYTNGVVSHNCAFLGSSNTLLSGECLEKLSYQEPLRQGDGISIYEEPIEGGIYVGCVDVSEGIQKDFSTIQFIRVDEKPYKQVFVYKRNDISPWDFPAVINLFGVLYNNAYLMIENNSIGKIVADSLSFEYDYENLLSSSLKKGEEELNGFSMKTIGMRTTRKTKSVGCSSLKVLIEKNHLLLVDFGTIQELSSFIKHKTSYAAEDGKYDDLVTPLILFAWITSQPFFEDISDNRIQDLLKEQREKEAEDSHLAFGFCSDGTENYE